MPDVTHWETSGTSGSGTITVSNPTDVEMFQTWVLTRGTWTVPDVSWTGRPRRRTPGGLYGSRSIPLKPVTSTHGTLTIQLDPMHVMMQSANGTNVMGEVGGGYYFMHTIPPHTPKTQLPISVTGAPAGGARRSCISRGCGRTSTEVDRWLPPSSRRARTVSPRSAHARRRWRRFV
ncbi:hypothetical protein GS421_03240 [Rhodococcus hoagii]|nr:hypothetical protein [Prescottella equi]